jgi:hypothetical protein
MDETRTITDIVEDLSDTSHKMDEAVKQENVTDICLYGEETLVLLRELKELTISTECELDMALRMLKGVNKWKK